MDSITILIIACSVGVVFLAIALLVIVVVWFQNREKKVKAQLAQVAKERASLQKILSETERMDIFELRRAIVELGEKRGIATNNLAKLEQEAGKRRQALEKQIAELDAQIADKRKNLVILDDEILLQSFGFYKPRYDLQNSELYKARLEQIRDKQRVMVKNGEAASCPTNWTVNNNVKEGERMIKDYIKLIVRSFNNECDASIINVKFNNITSIEKKIRNAFDTLNSLGKRMNITLSLEYLNLKIEELRLCYEYQVKKQQEKEEQKRIREQMREEAKLLKEIEEMRFKIEKEEKHFNKAIESVNSRLEKAQTDTERQLLEDERSKILERLAGIEKDKEDIQKREQNTRAGYVYIISNVGSFGENIYKIGVTRRLDPTERVDELGDASVPFNFDIHATIFSDDAPALENALHKAFEPRRLNVINRRREFFNVTLKEIEEVVKKNFNKPVEFVELADAPEYRQSLLLKESPSA